MDLFDFLFRQTFVKVAPCRLHFGRPRVLLERLTFGRKPGGAAAAFDFDRQLPNLRPQDPREGSIRCQGTVSR